MSNPQWTKNTQDIETRMALTEQKVEEHGEILRSFSNDLAQIKLSLATLLTKLDSFNPTQATIHQNKIENLEKRIDITEQELGKITRKVIYWSGGLAVVFAILAYFVFPTVVNKLSNEVPTQTIVQKVR